MATATKRQVKLPATNGRTTKRLNVVMIRKSGSQQDEKGQADNVGKGLAEQGISIDPKYWFYCTVPRAYSEGNADFKRLMELVQTGKVGTIYVETQDRFGTDDAVDFFTMIKTLRINRTRLYDLREKMDLTQKDDRTLMTIFLAAMKSSKERKDIGFRTTRKKVPLFMETGSWPSGSHPFGYGKRCYASDGKTLLWEWQPSSRTKGQQFFPVGKKLKAGPTNVSIPKKESGKRWVTKLVPSNNKEDVKTVQLIFDLFVYEGLSYRKISEWLNDEDRKFYDRPFTFGLVREILKNPAYVGDTHFGKTQTAQHYTFDTSANTVEIESDEDFDEVVITNGKKPPAKRRPVEERLVKQDTHKGLITRQVWKLAQEKIAAMDERPSFSPRKPEYYLKPILVCGHCGENMTGGWEGKGDKKIVAYMCSSYRSGKSNGQKVKCGSHRITHADAERLLLDKIKELKLDFDELGSMAVTASIKQSLDLVEMEKYDNAAKDEKLIAEGIAALRAYYKGNYDSTSAARKRFEEAAKQQYEFWKIDRTLFTKQFREIVRHAEAESVAEAKAKLAKLDKDHTRLTAGWGDATDKMREKLKSQAADIESQMDAWKDRTKTISERLAEIRQTGHEMYDRYSSLLDEWPALELREKGESLRRIFKTVKLYWQPHFHPSSDSPSRPRSTNRDGRFSYELLTDKIGWEFAALNLCDSR